MVEEVLVVADVVVVLVHSSHCLLVHDDTMVVDVDEHVVDDEQCVTCHWSSHVQWVEAIWDSTSAGHSRIERRRGHYGRGLYHSSVVSSVPTCQSSVLAERRNCGIWPIRLLGPC